MAPLIDRLQALLPGLRKAEAEAADVALVWRLVCLPIDFDPPRRTRWLDLSRLALRHLAGRRTSAQDLLPEVPRHASVEVLEEVAGAARDARALLRHVSGVGGVTPDVAQGVEQECARRITRLLPAEITSTSAGRCRSCERPCPPWAPTCDDCRDGRPPARGRRTSAPARRAPTLRRA